MYMSGCLILSCAAHHSPDAARVSEYTSTSFVSLEGKQTVSGVSQKTFSSNIKVIHYFLSKKKKNAMFYKQ